MCKAINKYNTTLQKYCAVSILNGMYFFSFHKQFGLGLAKIYDNNLLVFLIKKFEKI